MTPSDPCITESERLATLHALRILDTPSEPVFDALVRAAALVARRPISLLSLVDASRTWFKANVGLDGATEAPREYAFCQHVVNSGRVFEVADTREDPRFAANPLVTGQPNIRAYTGVPIDLDDGTVLGALCVMASEPGSLSAEQVGILQHLGHAAGLAIAQRAELVRQREAAESESAHARHLEKELRASEAFLHRTGRVAGVGGWELDLESSTVRWSEQICRIHEVAAGYQPSLDEAVSYYAPEARQLLAEAIGAAVEKNLPWDMELPMVTARGRPIWVRAVGALEREGDVPVKLSGALQDITDRRRAMQALETSERRFRKLFQYSLGLICTHDLEGIVLAVNPAAAASIGYGIGDILGRSLGDFMRPERRPYLALYLERIRSQRIDAGMFELVAPDGSLRYWRYQNVLDTDAEDPYVLGHAQDVTAQKSYEKTLLDWSTRDALTHAMNRRYLAGFEAEQTDDMRWACVAVDIDHFKQVNDTHGHQRGDELLLAVADILRGACVPGDVVVRMGGDEFIVILRDPRRVDEALAHVARAQAGTGVSLSMGVALREAGASVDDVIAEADRALYAGRTHSRREARH
ncbi:diguanylate cyclase [Luteibacter sp. ME-Dv--P-043b]|uniref:sensor domain-containing diguanylate cyclase n=1 Tax=unclassified Luteibacter TaxID=2620188 RepID=UPI0025571D15|nr:diguanylate cyclase [Luteibacter sp. ME-Dv--P-043b]